MRPGSFSRAMATCALVASFMLLAVATAFPDSREDLAEQIYALETRARFEEAAALADQLFSLVQSDPSSQPFEVVDAEWRLRMLESAAQLTEEEQRELALVNDLQKAADDAWETGDYQAGLAAARRRLEILRSYLGGEHPEVARSLDDVGGFLDELGESDEGEKLALEALEMRLALLGEKHPLVAESLNNLAHLAYSTGDYAVADSLAGRAVDTYRSLFGEEHPDLAVAIGNRALYKQLQGRYEEARALYSESIRLGKEAWGRESLAHATDLDNLATLLLDMGDYASAEPLCREALAIERKLLGESHPMIARALGNLGVLLLYQGRYEEAEEVLLDALEMRRSLFGEDHPSVQNVLGNLAVLHFERREFDSAEAIHRESLAILKETLGPEHPRTMLAIHNLACDVGDGGDLEEAERLFQEALELRRGALGDEHPDVAATLRALGGVMVQTGRYAESEALYREALEILGRTLGDVHPDVAGCLQDLGQTLMLAGDVESSVALLTDAAGTYDLLRPRAGLGYARATFMDPPYVDLAGALLLAGRSDEAWPAAERGLGRALAEFLMSAEKRELTPAEEAREDSLYEERADLEAQLVAYRQSPRSRDRDDFDQITLETERKLALAEAEWASFRREMSLKYPLSEGRAFGLSRVQASLDPTTAMVGWLDVPREDAQVDLWAYVIRDTGSVRWTKLGRHARGGAYVERPTLVRHLVSDPETPVLASRRELVRLWEERFNPIVGSLEGARELVIIPSGRMLGVPIEALVDPDGRILGELYAVSYAPSATIRAWLAEMSGEAGGGSVEAALLVGDPTFMEAAPGIVELPPAQYTKRGASDLTAATVRKVLSGDRRSLGELPRLSGTRREIELIAPLVSRSDVLLGEEASEQALLQLAESGEIASYQVLHIATHALVDDRQPERSSLVLSQVGLPDPLEAALSGERANDGLLSAGEIVRHWDVDADLVTLSACETGLGQKVGGEGYIGLAHALFRVGARCILVSLWEVEDEATALLMRRFYENWLGAYDESRGGMAGERMTKARALQEAKTWLRSYEAENGARPYEPPFFWSAFVLMGDGGR